MDIHPKLAALVAVNDGEESSAIADIEIDTTVTADNIETFLRTTDFTWKIGGTLLSVAVDKLLLLMWKKRLPGDELTQAIRIFDFAASEHILDTQVCGFCGLLDTCDSYLSDMTEDMTVPQRVQLALYILSKGPQTIEDAENEESTTRKDSIDKAEEYLKVAEDCLNIRFYKAETRTIPLDSLRTSLRIMFLLSLEGVLNHGEEVPGLAHYINTLEFIFEVKMPKL